MDQKKTNPPKKKSQNRNTDSKKSLFRIAQSIDDIANKYKAAAENDKETEKKFRIPIRISIISVLVNAVLALVTFLLWNQAVKQSKAAEDAADLAKQSIELAQENFRIENSALLAPNLPTFPFDHSYQSPIIYITITNFGKTVAESVFCWYNYIVSEKYIPDNPIIRKEFSKIPSFILPGGDSVIEDAIDRKYVNSDSSALASKKMKFFFYGEVRYKTIGKFDTLEFMYVNTSIKGTGDFIRYGTFNKLR